KGTISIEEHFEPHAAVGPVVRSHVGEREIELTDPVYLLSWPGALTFGHWITDVIGRIELAARHGGGGTRQYLSPNPLRPWRTRCRGFCGRGRDRLLRLDKTTTYRCPELIAPTIMGHMSGGPLPVEFLKPVFDRHRETLAAWLPAKRAQTDLVFITHTRMTS